MLQTISLVKKSYIPKINLGLIDIGKCIAYSEEPVLFIYSLYGRFFALDIIYYMLTSYSRFIVYSCYNLLLDWRATNQAPINIAV